MPLGSYAIFCDDIRQEANGKLIFIGVYNDDMYFQGSPPWTHSKLCIHALCRSLDPTQRSVKLTVNAQTAVDISTLWENDLVVDEEIPVEGGFEFEEERPTFYQFMFGVILSPLVIKGETRLEVVVTQNGQSEVIDRLRIRGVKDEHSQPDEDSVDAAL